MGGVIVGRKSRANTMIYLVQVTLLSRISTNTNNLMTASETSSLVKLLVILRTMNETIYFLPVTNSAHTNNLCVECEAM